MSEPTIPAREQLEKEVQLHFFRGSGPGGQHRNKTETGVRLFHPPTGITVAASERRSQARNRELAFERLEARLRARLRRRKPRVPTRKPRSVDARRVDAKRQRGRTKRERQTPQGE